MISDQQPETKRAKYKFLPYFLYVSSFLVIAIPHWLYLHAWSLAIYATLVGNFLILAVYYREKSVPVIDLLVEREYRRIQKKLLASFRNDSHFFRCRYDLAVAYLRLLYYIAILCRNFEDNMALFINDNQPLNIQTNARSARQSRVRQAYLQEFEMKYQHDRRHALGISLCGSAAASTIVLGIFLFCFVLPRIFNVQAATFGWVQSDWSGGFATTTATHPDNKSSWTKFSTSSGISVVGGKLQITSSTEWVKDAAVFATSSPNNFATGGYFYNGSGTAVDYFGSMIHLATTTYFGNTIGGLSTPWGIAFDNNHNYIWISNQNSNKIKVYNASTGVQVGSDISTCSTPVAMAADSTHDEIFVLCYSGSVLQRYSGSTLTQVGSNISVNGSARDVVYDSANDALWTVGDGATVEKFDRSSGTRLASTSTAAGSWDLAYDPTNNAIWVANYFGSTVQEIDAAALGLIRSISGFSSPAAIAFDSAHNSVWVTNSGNNTMQEFSASTGLQIGSTLAVGNTPEEVYYDALSNAVWVIAYDANLVQKYDASTAAKLSEFYLGSSNNPRGVTFQNNPSSVWVANYTANSVTQISAATARPQYVQSSTTINATSYGAAYDPVNNLVWTTGGGSSGKLQRFYGDSGLSAGSDIAAGNAPRGVVYVSSTNAVWVANYSDNTLQVFNASTGAQVGSNISTGSGNPEWFCYDSVNNAVWVTMPNASAVIKYDASTMAKVGSSVAVGGTPADIACDTVNNTVWVAVGSTNVVKSFDAATGAAKLSDIATGSYPRGITYDSRQNAVWVVNNSSQTMQKFNASTGAQIGSDISVGGTVSSRGVPHSVIYDELNNTVWVRILSNVNNVGNDLEGYDAASGSKVARVITGARHYDKANLVVDHYHNALWLVNTDSNSLYKMAASLFSQSGVFTSAAIDFGQNVIFSTVAWLPSSQLGVLGANPLSFQIAVNDDNSTWNYVGPDGTASTYYTTSGQNASSSGSISGRYLKYKSYLTSNVPTSTPLLSNISFNYTKFATSSYLISSAYDSTNDANIISRINWTGVSTSVRTIKFQIRAASSSAALASAAWCGYDDSGSCDGTNYFEAADRGKAIPAGNPLMQSGANRWFQYKVILSTSDSVSPELDSVTISYVVNEQPQFSTTTAATASQGSDGLVHLVFSAADPDTDSDGAACPNCVIPSFEYSIDNGASWNPISAGLAATATATTTIGVDFSAYDIVWDAKDQLDGTYATATKVRITINDLEGGNNTAVTTTAAFALDVKNPAVASAKLIASSTPTMISLNASDDNSFQMCISTSLGDIDSHCSAYAATSTISLGAYTRVYLKFVDSLSNSTSLSVEAPETPTSMVIRDISDTATPVYQELIAWKAVSGSFSKYHVWYSVDGGAYSEVATIADRSINYYFHQSLTAGATYSYKVYVEDSDGNTSQFSSVVSDITDGFGGTNTTPPAIADVEVVATTTQSATIEWDTNDLANSNVHYSANSAPPFNLTTGVVSLTDNASGVGRHHVVLTGLTPDTDYYFSVESENALGVAATDNNGGGGYSFHTAAGPKITDVTTNQVSNSGATIIWNTDISGDSYVYYSSSSSFTITNNAGSSVDTTSHSVTLTGLELGTTYYFYVKSGVAQDDNGGSYYSFTTSRDGVAPVISSVSTTVATDVKALITWSTNELADSKIEYGTAAGVYTATVEDSTLSLNHRLLLSDLSSSTAYYYHVISADASNNTASSTEYSFTTLEKLSEESEVLERELAAAASSSGSTLSCGGGGGSYIDRSSPTLSNLAASSINSDSAVINWQTNRAANSIVGYGLSSGSTEYWSNKLDSVASHSVTLKNLIADSTYYAQAFSIDANGNVGSSTIISFKTLTTKADAAASVEAATDKEATYLAAIKKTSDILSLLSSQVSVNALESSLTDQYNLIRQLSQSLPAPLLSGEPRVLVTSDTATITWSTDKESNSLVGIAPASQYVRDLGDKAYLQTVGNATESVRLHTVTIYDLEPETSYHYQIKSMTGLGATGKSSDFTFTTRPKELEISNYTVEKISAQSAVFRWLTNNETNSQVKYIPYRNGALDIDAAKTVKEKNYSTLHEVAIDNFESGIIYEVELSGTDIKNQTVSRKISSFSTGDDNFPPTIYQVQTESALSAGKESNVQTIISWLTDESATSQVFYQQGVGAVDENAWESTPLDMNYSKKHIVVITKFEAGQIYQFKINSQDSNGNLTTSKIYTILAPKQKESVFQVIMKNFEDIFGWTKNLNN